MTDFFIEHVMDGGAIKAEVLVAGSDSDVVREVAAHAGAIGFVSMSWAARGAKALSMSAVNGLPYVFPDAETVYRGEYPLSRPYLFEVRAAGPRLAHGFITYVTSQDGQRIVHEAGLVPTAVPVRFVRRSRYKGPLSKEVDPGTPNRRCRVSPGRVEAAALLRPRVSPWAPEQGGRRRTESGPAGRPFRRRLERFRKTAQRDGHAGRAGVGQVAGSPAV